VSISVRQCDPEFRDGSPAEFLWQPLAGLHDHDDLLVTMLTAYYDASGKENLGHVSVAGWLSTARKWADFQSRWNGVLEHFNIPYFHASSFENSKGPFSDWKDDESRRRELIECLATIVRDTALFGVSSTVYYDDFTAAAELLPDIRLQFKNAYVLAARDCMKRIDHHARKLRIEGKRASVAHVFERGDEGMGRLVEMCQKTGEDIPQFHPSTPNANRGHVVQLQSADLLAYECFRLAPQSQAERFNTIYLDDVRLPVKLLHDIPRAWVRYDYKRMAARALQLLLPPNETN